MTLSAIMPATGAERVARHRRRQQEHTAELERQVEDLQATVARLEAEHSECLPLLARPLEHRFVSRMFVWRTN